MGDADESCGCCRHFLAASAPGIRGLCRRYPPTVIGHDSSVWPSVAPIDRCGEWTIRPDALGAETHELGR